MKTVQVLAKGIISALQDCFNVAEQSKCAEGADLEEYTSADLSYTNLCTVNVTTTKTLELFHNQKQWLNSEVGAQLKAQGSAFKVTCEANRWRFSITQFWQVQCTLLWSAGKAASVLVTPTD